jgi:hypothetical protein
MTDRQIMRPKAGTRVHLKIALKAIIFQLKKINTICFETVLFR